VTLRSFERISVFRYERSKFCSSAAFGGVGR
jgi:hypothetical protein